MTKTASAGRAAVGLALLWCFAPGASVLGQSKLAIVGGRLIDGFGGAPVERSVVLIEGDRIAAVGRMAELEVPEDSTRIDAYGMTVLPGLWESHGHLMHLGAGDPADYLTRFKERIAAIMARVAEINLAAGVTSFRDVAGPLEEQKALRDLIEAGEKNGPRLFLSGPILTYHPEVATGTPERDLESSVIREVGEVPIRTADEAREAAEELVSKGVDLIKVFGFTDAAPLREIVEVAHRAGIGVDADVRHVAAYSAALEAGVDRLHHVFTADPLSDYSDSELRALVRGAHRVAIGPWTGFVRGPYVIPTIEMRRAYVRVADYPGLLDHPRLREQYGPELYSFLRSSWNSFDRIPWGRGSRRRVDIALAKLRRFIEAGGAEQLVAGCDTGSPLNLHAPVAREIANFVEAGLSPMEAIQSATIRAAEMQGVDRDLGSIAEGKLADIIIVDGDPLREMEALERHVVHVIKGGRWYR